MADQVPDPDDGMSDHDVDHPRYNDQVPMVDEPDEPTDDLNLGYLDSTNSNQEEFVATADEAAPAAPEDAFRTIDPKAVYRKPINGNDILVYTEAVDLETICAQFKGAVLQERLQFIVDHCPVLRRDASIALVRTIKETSMNVTRYNIMMALLEKRDDDTICTRNLEMPKVDHFWVDTTQARAQNMLDSLQAEYKKMKDEGVKESTRRAMEELFSQYIAVGNYFDALRLYGRGMREYCTQFKHLMKMWLEWIEISVISGEWQKVEPLISQTQRCINEAEEAEEVALNSNRQQDGHAQGDQHSRANRALIAVCQAKIDALSGVVSLRAAQFTKALDKLTKIDVDLMGSQWLFSSSDLAVFTTLAALVAYDRAELKKRVLTDSLCRKYLESEPKLIELLTCFIKSDFGKCLDILKQRKDSFYLNPYISFHVDDLYNRIRQRAIIQYIKPFATARLDVMADVFRVSPVSEMENEVVELIEENKISAKIDALQGVVQTISVEKRTETVQLVNVLFDKVKETANSVICRSLITHSRMFTGSTKRKETSDEGFDPLINRNRVFPPGAQRMLGERHENRGRGTASTSSNKRRAEPDSSENHEFMYDL